MRTAELLAELHSRDIKVWGEAGRLRYDAPQGALTPDLRDELVKRKTEVLDLLRKADTLTDASTSSLSPVPRDGPQPLSFAQRRLWFLHQLEPGQSAFNVAWAVKLKGDLHVAALRQTLNAVVDRHEVLRTTYMADEDGEPVQVIAKTAVVSLEQVDLASLPAAERETELRRQIDQRVNRPFDLAAGPILRVSLFRLAPDEHVLSLAVHHIAFDGWSFGVLAREVAALYAAFVEGHEPTLPQLTIQYADFAAWQREWLQGEVLEAQLEYWRNQLGSDMPLLELPTDRPRPSQQTFAGARESAALPETLVASLRALSQREGATLFMILATGLNVLLQRYSGQSSIAIGTPVANRTRADLEPLIGFFVNSLVLRTELQGEPSFREALMRVREVCLGAYAHQDLPFEQLVEALRPQRDPSRHPLFQVMFALQNVPSEDMSLPGLKLSAFAGARSSSQFDLTLSTGESGDGLWLTIEYNTDLFEPATIRRMLSHYEALLSDAVANPDRAISQLSFLSDAERWQLLSDWNATTTAYPREATLAERFEAQVAATPDGVALAFEDQQLSYRELDARASQLAGYLQQRHGVGSEVRVGLYLPRSVEMIVGVLGIIKAGGAYVPLDPTAPPGRRAFIIEDADVAVVLTLDDERGELPGEWSGPVVALDGEWPTIADASATDLTSDATAESLAYIMYTSGSTGVPKGTSIRQRSVLRLVMNQNYLEFGPDETFLQFGPLAFDASTLELWGSLLHGSKLVVYPPHQASLEELARCLEEHEISTLWLTAAIFHQMVDSHPAALSGVRQLLSGGDVLSVPHVQRVLANLPDDGVLINGYGPTENTTFTCCHVMTRDSRVENTVPIGRPIANTRVYVLDAAMQPVPVGVYGELYIGGDGLARDYLKRPALTAEKFVPDPFSEAPGSRLYRTGDLVRYRPDGSLEFQGRRDHQVKLRGYRIELGEIETVLAQHPTVQACVALVREDEPGDKRLVGYVVPAQRSASDSDLRRHMREHIPDYMVPAHFVPLDAIPVTPNGKVDRRALPAPEGLRPQLDAAYQAPQGSVEEALAEIWTKILRMDRVGRFDNFFELGGHSLLATQVVARVRDRLGVEMPLRVLFDGPTVADMALHVGMLSQTGVETEAPPLAPLARSADRRLPLSFAQQRLWFLEQLEPGGSAYSMPYALRLRGPLDVPVLSRSLNELVKRHETLRTIFAQGGDEPVQVILPTLELIVPLVDLESLPEPEREAEMQRLRSKEALTPFELAVGPLIRAQVIRMDADHHVLLLTMHHIISDGWSMDVFFRELGVVYQSCCDGRAPSLPRLAVQYADYAVWQRAYLQGECLEQEVNYWRAYLHDPLPTLQLPTDFIRPSGQTHRGARAGLMLSAELKSGLVALSPQKGTTLFMTLLAVFQSLVHRWSGQDDVCVGIPSAGRTRVETEGLVGFFINTLVVRTMIEKDWRFRDLLEQVRDGVLGAQAHQTVPFERLVEVLQPTRDLARTPVFQVMFNMVPGGTQTISLPGITVEGVGLQDRESKFDLTLYVQDSEAGIHLNLLYNADLFRPERMQTFLAQFHAIAEQVVQDPDRALAAYTLVTGESESLLPDPKALLAAPSQDRVSDLVAAWAADRPDETAVTQSGRSWTYGELVAQSSALTRELQETGVEAGIVVGVFGRPSFGLIASLLGVLRSGGVLVLMDPALPDERKRLMLRQAGARLLLQVGTDEQDTAWLDGADGPQAIRVSPDTGVVVPGQTIPRLKADSEPASALPLADAAYIFFSSGTTGTPKGIVGSHQSLGHFIAWQRKTYEVGPTDRVAQLTGLGFDAVLRDVFLPLTSGGTLCLPDEVPEQDGEQVLHWLERAQITVLHTVPTVAGFWLSQAPADVSLRSLRWVFLSGEPLTEGLVKTWREAFPDSGRLVNFYGTTETTLIKCYHEIPALPHPGVQPVEKSLPQTQALVLNAEQQLCGVGELGEIVIRTPFRSLGYLTEQGEVRSPFRPNPHSDGEPEDLYYTGDLGRYRPDGLLDILGRRDDQIKIRGVRIEPPEVMHALSAHPAVQACFVMARADATGAPALVAYVVPAADGAPSAAELRTHLARRLPAAMVPSSLVFLEALPYTPNGKIDRQALPSPDAAEGQPEIEYVAPKTSTEKQLAKIWQEVLELDRVGIEDDFFNLGGHSLLAVRVIAQVRDQINVELPLLRLFETPTIGGLAELIETIHLADLGHRSRGEATASEPEEEEGEL